MGASPIALEMNDHGLVFMPLWLLSRLLYSILGCKDMSQTSMVSRRLLYLQRSVRRSLFLHRGHDTDVKSHAKQNEYIVGRTQLAYEQGYINSICPSMNGYSTSAQWIYKKNRTERNTEDTEKFKSSEIQP